jgi:hypothetical protein
MSRQFLKIMDSARGAPLKRTLIKKFRTDLVEFGLRSLLLPLRVRHVHGPRTILYGPEELLVITVVRNGEIYIKAFMEHYRAMGVRHCVFLDNGSTDRTVERLCSYEAVTVLRTEAPYKHYENTMKRYLAERFSKDRWNLCADIDELFDYPHSDCLSLADFLAYLNKNRYTVVIAQMLDMFSAAPLSDLESTSEESLKSHYPYYDLSLISKSRYRWGQPANNAIKMHWGGIRNRVFGTHNGLTKAALVKMDGKIKPFVGWHHVRNGAIADVSAVLLHYPFTGSFYAKVKEAARSGRYGRLTTDEYIAYWKTLAKNPNLQFKFEHAERLKGLDELIAQEFLAVSEQYEQWFS